MTMKGQRFPIRINTQSCSMRNLRASRIPDAKGRILYFSNELSGNFNSQRNSNGMTALFETRAESLMHKDGLDRGRSTASTTLGGAIQRRTWRTAVWAYSMI
jgi:hypothetical protein